MTRFENREFRFLVDQSGENVFNDFEFHRCAFRNCALSLTPEVAKRSVIKNVRMVDCESHHANLGCAVLENVVVDGLKTNGTCFIRAAAFKHVILQGRIEDIAFKDMLAPGRATPGQQAAADEANQEFYQQVDWALDITAAEFANCDLTSSIPFQLIRRDAETQVVVPRAKAMQGEWRKLDLTGTHWGYSLEEFLKTGDPAAVLVAPKRSQKFKALLRGLQALRQAGVAEPT